MSNIDLTQTEADALLAMGKISASNDLYKYPDMGGSLRIPLTTEDGREDFMLDIYRGKIELKKGTLQNRARQVFILARLDYAGAPHRNPDGEEIPCSHLHLYREGFGSKWAVPVAEDKFPDIANNWKTLQDFMKFCNIIDPPKMIRGLFT